MTSNSSRQRVGLDHEAVVARRLERIVEAGEQPLAVVVDHVGLAVHEILGPDDRAAKGLAHRLMAEAHAQQRQLALRAAGSIRREMPASVGVHGPGEMITRSGLRSSSSSTVIWSLRKTWMSSSRIDLAQPLHEVVGERIVVIDDEDHVVQDGTDSG